MRSISRIILVGGVVALVVMGGQGSWATIENLKTYKKAYPDQAKAASCRTCHQDALGKKGNLNMYGKALQAQVGAGKATELTVKDLRAAESNDADGDGVSNGDEIKAGTNPADPTSKPAAAAHSSTQSTSSTTQSPSVSQEKEAH